MRILQQRRAGAGGDGGDEEEVLPKPPFFTNPDRAVKETFAEHVGATVSFSVRMVKVFRNGFRI